MVYLFGYWVMVCVFVLGIMGKGMWFRVWVRVYGLGYMG